MNTCKIHTSKVFQPTVYVNKADTFDGVCHRLAKQTAKKKAYKATTLQLRQELKQLLQKNMQLESRLPQQYRMNSSIIQQDKQSQQDYINLQDELAHCRNNLIEIRQQWDDSKALAQGLDLENIQLKCQLSGKNEECGQLHNQIVFYQNRIQQLCDQLNQRYYCDQYQRSK